jgi:hypothetical protein
VFHGVLIKLIFIKHNGMSFVNRVIFVSLSLNYQATYHDTPCAGHFFLSSTQLGFITQLQLVYGFTRAYTLKPSLLH